MPELALDARVAELVILDVLDLTEDGKLVLNAGFVAECRARFEADPSCIDTVFQARILARAAERGYACVDVDDLALVALEVAVENATEMGSPSSS